MCLLSPDLLCGSPLLYRSKTLSSPSPISHEQSAEGCTEAENWPWPHWYHLHLYGLVFWNAENRRIWHYPIALLLWGYKLWQPRPACYNLSSPTTSFVLKKWNSKVKSRYVFKSKCTNIKYQYIIQWFRICRCSFNIKGKNFSLRPQMLILYTDGKIWKLSISTTDHWSSPWGRCWLALPESPVEYWSFLVNPPVPGRHYRRLGGPPQISPSLLGLFQLLDVTVY